MMKSLFDIARSLYRPTDEPEDAEKQLRLDYQATFGTDAGRRVLADMASRHYVYRPMMAYDSDDRADPLQMAVHEGERSVVLFIVQKVNTPLFETQDRDEVADE